MKPEAQVSLDLRETQEVGVTLVSLDLLEREIQASLVPGEIPVILDQVEQDSLVQLVL